MVWLDLFAKECFGLPFWWETHCAKDMPKIAIVLVQKHPRTRGVALEVPYVVSCEPICAFRRQDDRIELGRGSLVRGVKAKCWLAVLRRSGADAAHASEAHRQPLPRREI